MMSRGALSKIILIGGVLSMLCGCVLYRPVSLLEDETVGCKFIGDVSTMQCGSGGPGSETINSLKNEVHKLGGNALVCCTTKAEETVLYGRNQYTGQLCTGWYPQFGRAYLCSDHPKTLNP